MKQAFIHLRVHSEYSLSDGIVRVEPLVDACAKKDMPAVAITDRNNFFALIKFYNACESSGVKPIVGSDVHILGDSAREEATPLLLIARTNEGYANLCELISRSYAKRRSMGFACLRRSWIEEKGAGLIALSGGPDGDLGRALLAGNLDDARMRISRWQRTFPDSFYLELHRTGREGEEEYNALAVKLAAETGCPVVATNDVRFLTRAEFEAHEVRVCIHESRTLDDPRRQRRYSDQQYLKSAKEMCELFEDVPEAIENTVEIAKRSNVNLNLGNCYLPAYPVPAGKTTESFLQDVASRGLNERLEELFDTATPEFTGTRARYEERLAFELGVINKMGFAGYFLIVMEFIQWARDNSIPVGPGRGSGAGSLVAYSLKITDIDPLAYNLLFERFLNPERISLPDFDIDFCMDGRDRVIQHVSERYGREAVSQIITFGTMAAKAVVRDVARVQGKPYGLADKLAKLIPFDQGMTLKKALEEEPALKEFVEQDEEAEEIMEMAFQLEGLARNIGRHAGGVVIAPTRLTDFVPTYSDETGDGFMTQFDMNDVELAGLVKFDFLGLKTLTTIDRTVKSINRKRAAAGESSIDIGTIALEDPAVYNDLREARTTAVFQLESRGMKDLMKRVKPGRFMDIVALVALFRPGPMKLANDFINRKHGKEKVDYLHPSLKHVLEETYGVMLYQEQVMQIAQILAGYTLADADLLRRAMGKKKPEEMAEQRAVFIKGAKENGVDEQRADHIFNLMERFAGYGFNKPHSVAYALIAYQTAWLKHHYPADFMAAVLSADMQDTDKVVINIEECKEMSLEIIPPDVNRGEYRFVADGDQGVVYGLGAIKGLGEGPVASLVAARAADGKFKDLYDFCERVDSRKVNRRALDALVGSGALDQLVTRLPSGTADEIGYRRALLIAHQDEAAGLAEQKARNQDRGLGDLFGAELPAGPDNGDRYGKCKSLRCLSFRDRLAREKDSLGLYLTGHLIDEYQKELRHLADTRIVDLKLGKKKQTIAGLVVAIRAMKGKSGDKVAFVTLDDKTGRVEVTVTSALLKRHGDKLKQDEVVIVTGSASEDDFTRGIKMRANEISMIETTRAGRLKRLGIDVTETDAGDDFADVLAKILSPFRAGEAAGCPVAVKYSNKNTVAAVILGDEWRVLPSDALLRSLRERYGSGHVHLHYA